MVVLVVLELVSAWPLEMEKADDEDILQTFFISLFCMIIQAGIFL